MYKFFISLILFGNIIAAEPSAFLAGNLDSSNPYGLTETEKHILNNKETIEDLKNKVISLETTLEEFQSSLEGFISISQGGNEKVFNINKKILQLETGLNIQGDYQKKFDDDLKKISIGINETTVKQEQINIQNAKNGEALKLAIKELSELIDNINDTYVHKDDLRVALNKLIEQVQDNKGIQKKQKTDLKDREASEIFLESKSEINNKNFNQAQKNLEYLVKNRDYKKAEVLFLLGEVYYQTGHFKKSITVFKKSAKMDDKASYMNVLLFHAGVAFEKTGHKKEAIQFFESLITLYPKSYLVNSAKKRLEKLNKE